MFKNAKKKNSCSISYRMFSIEIHTFVPSMMMWTVELALIEMIF